MSQAEQYLKELAEFYAREDRACAKNDRDGARRWRDGARSALKRIRRMFERRPRLPGDPYAYVTATIRPRLPHLGPAAAAEDPD